MSINTKPTGAVVSRAIKQTVMCFPVCTCHTCFFFGQSSKCLSADRHRCKHRCFYVITCFVDIFINGMFLTKQTIFSCNPFSDLREPCLQNLANLVSPATISTCKLPWNTSKHVTIFNWYTSKPTEDKLKWDEMVDKTADWAQRICNKQLQGTYDIVIYMYTQFSPQI